MKIVAILSFLLLAFSLYGQTDLDINYIELERIHIPDSSAKRYKLKTIKEFAKIAGREISVVSEVHYNRNGYLVKDIRYAENGSDSVETLVDLLPDSLFVVTHKVNAKKQRSKGTFSMYLDELQKSVNQGTLFELRSLYKVNVDSTIEIVTEVNGRRTDNIHYIPNYKFLAEALNEEKEPLKQDTCRLLDSLIIITRDSTDPDITRLKKVYYIEGSAEWVKTEHINYRSDSLIHQGIVFRQFDPQGRITYYAEQIGGRFWVIEKTVYDAHGGKTVERSSNPAEGKKFPDFIYKYDGSGRMVKSARNSNREKNTYLETSYKYSKTGLLLNKVHYRNKKLTGTTSYVYDVWDNK